VANLQVKGMDDELYAEIKRLADAENRSLSQQVVLILREYLAKQGAVARAKTPAEVLLDLAGSWEDDRGAPEIAADLTASRRSSRKLADRL